MQLQLELIWIVSFEKNNKNIFPSPPQLDLLMQIILLGPSSWADIPETWQIKSKPSARLDNTKSKWENMLLVSPEQFSVNWVEKVSNLKGNPNDFTHLSVYRTAAYVNK